MKFEEAFAEVNRFARYHGLSVAVDWFLPGEDDFEYRLNVSGMATGDGLYVEGFDGKRPMLTCDDLEMVVTGACLEDMTDMLEELFGRVIEND